MKIDQIPTLPAKKLREVIQNFWANFRFHKEFLTLGCALNRIKREELWKIWGHKSMTHYAFGELHFPYGQHAPYIAAYVRCKSFGLTVGEFSETQQKNSLYRVLKATKQAREKQELFQLLSFGKEDFRHQMRLREEKLQPVLLNRKQAEIVCIASRILGRHIDRPDKQAIGMIAVFVASLAEKGPKKRSQWIETRCRELKIQEPRLGM